MIVDQILVILDLYKCTGVFIKGACFSNEFVLRGLRMPSNGGDVGPNTEGATLTVFTTSDDDDLDSLSGRIA